MALKSTSIKVIACIIFLGRENKREIIIQKENIVFTYKRDVEI